ncbi:MAG: hypothetical protein ABSG32_17745 [Terriglobia bacterium]|jgi:hypothetical protein
MASIPGPICGATRSPGDNKDGTLCSAPSPKPGPTREEPPQPNVLLSPAFKVLVDIPFSIAPGLTWDAFNRLIYDRMNQAIQSQANMLIERGNVTYQEAQSLVESQRNALVIATRDRLSPFGRLYSEILKPRASLKTLDQFLEEKGSIEAVLESVGKTRQVVDRISTVSRTIGPEVIILELAFTAIAIAQAPAGQKGRVAAKQIGGSIGGVGGGLAGMWAGCAGMSLIVSPSLVVPVVGEVSEGTACFVGGIVGGLGLGFGLRKAGEAVGEKTYDFVTTLTWL